MVQYDLCSGGGGGYVAGFCSFLQDVINTKDSDESNIDGKPEFGPSNPLNAIFEGVDVDYEDHNIAAQIENIILPCLNSIIPDMKLFLQVGLPIPSEDLSPFLKNFEDFNDVASTYYAYLPNKLQSDLKDHTFPLQDLSASAAMDSEVVDEVQPPNLDQEVVNDLFDNVLNVVLNYNDETTRIPDPSSFMVPLTTLQEDVQIREKGIIIVCLRGHYLIQFFHRLLVEYGTQQKIERRLFTTQFRIAWILFIRKEIIQPVNQEN